MTGLIIILLVVFVPTAFAIKKSITYNKRITRLNEKRIAKGKKPWFPKTLPTYVVDPPNDGANDILNIGIAVTDVLINKAIHDKIYHNDNDNYSSYDDSFGGDGGKFGGGGSSGEW